jgi:hypothetical protein
METPAQRWVPKRSARPKQLLALDPALGSVVVCNPCRHFQVILGEVCLQMDLAGFQALLVLLSRAAANYELWAEQPGGLA